MQDAVVVREPVHLLVSPQMGPVHGGTPANRTFTFGDRDEAAATGDVCCTRASTPLGHSVRSASVGGRLAARIAG